MYYMCVRYIGERQYMWVGGGDGSVCQFVVDGTRQH